MLDSSEISELKNTWNVQCPIEFAMILGTLNPIGSNLVAPHRTERFCSLCEKSNIEEVIITNFKLKIAIYFRYFDSKIVIATFKDFIYYTNYELINQIVLRFLIYFIQTAISSRLDETDAAPSNLSRSDPKLYTIVFSEILTQIRSHMVKKIENISTKWIVYNIQKIQTLSYSWTLNITIILWL